MIQANELRIGNKVNAFYDDTCVTPGTFIETVAHIQQQKIMTEEDKHWVSVDNYSPIPLTLEWLAKFRFDWSIYHQAFHKENFEFDLNECYPSGFELMTFKKVKGIVPNIFYVHHLQNIYYDFTKTELTLHPIDTGS